VRKHAAEHINVERIIFIIDSYMRKIHKVELLSRILNISHDKKLLYKGLSLRATDYICRKIRNKNIYRFRYHRETQIYITS